ncbi:10168_t:CDS:2, partial [Gigaspora rosea]
LLALTNVESTIPSNITSIPPPKDNRFNLGNLSASCEDTLSKIVLSREFLICVPIPALLPLVPIIPEIGNIKKNPRELLNYLDPIDQFSNIICLVPKCSDKGVQSAIQEILNRCTTELNNNNTIVDAIAVADPEQVCTQCNKDIINTFGNFLKNNTFALQVLAQAGINQTLIDTMKIGVAVKYGINFEDGEVPNNSSQ